MNNSISKTLHSFGGSSLRSRLAVAFVAVALFAILVGGIATNIIASSELNGVLGDNFHELASRMGREAGNSIVTSETGVVGLSLSTFLQSQVAEFNQIGTADVSKLLELDQKWIAASDSDPLILNTLNGDLANELLEYQRYFPQYAELFITDRYGAVIASTNRTSDYYQADEEWWQNAWNDGEGGVYVSQPSFDESVGAYSVDIAVPVRSHIDDTVIGVLRATTSLKVLSELLSAGQFGDTGQAILLLPNNQYISHDSGVDILTLDAETVSAINTLQSDYGEIAYAGDASLVSTAQITTNSGQHEEVSQLGWVVVVHQDIAEAQAPIAKTTRGMLLTGFGVLVVAGLLALFMGGQLVRPIENLTTVAEKLAGGDLSVKAPETSRDEIGVLARAFNRMGAQLGELISGLEQRVAERTKELEAAQALMTKRAVELQAVAEISTEASQATDVDAMLQTVVEQTKKVYSLYHAHIYLLDDSGTQLELAAGAGEAGRKMVSEKRRIPLNHPHSLVARAARNIEGAISNDVTKEPDFLPNPLLPDTKAEMAIPIAIGNRLLGILDVQADYVNRFTDEDIAIKTTLAQQVAASLESIRQFETSQKVARELEMVAGISTATATISDANKLLQEVVDRTKSSFDLYHVHIYLLNEDENTLELAVGAGQVGRQMVSEGRQIPLDSEKSLVARAARTRAGVTVNDVRADPDFLPNPLLPDTRSEMAVPMLVGDDVVGVLDVQSEVLDRFTQIDINIKTTLAAQVAVALQNARTFAETQSKAEKEALLNAISQRIQSTTTIEAALQMTARELGLVLGKRQTFVALDVASLNEQSQAVVNE